MRMDAFPPDSADVRAKLGAYWGRLGLRPLVRPNADLYVRSLAVRLPTMADVLL